MFVVIKLKIMKKVKRLPMVVWVAVLVLFGTGAVCAQEKKFATVQIQTSAVCGMCKERLEGGLAFEKGVKDVSLNDSTKVLTIKYLPKSTTPDLLRKRVTKLGYDADDLPADKEAYNKLPACCKKDVPKH